MNTINSIVVTETGQEISSGVVCYQPFATADISRLETEGTVELHLEFYESEVKKQSGFKQIKPVYSLTDKTPIVTVMNIVGITSLEDAPAKCQAQVTEYLESIYNNIQES